ncbi:MAG: YjbF family lipoprotein [Idiomarina sp.]|nr:YjbF family lipoprotein [Idiomarina sp.]
MKKIILNLCAVTLGTVFLGSALTGCSAVTYDAVETWKYATTRTQDVVLTPEQISEFPYTALYARAGDGGQILVVLGFVDRTSDVQQLNWVTGSRESVSTEYARVVATSGLPRNIGAVSDTKDDPLRCILTQPERCEQQWVRQIDILGEHGAGTETLISQFEVSGPEMLELPTGTKEVFRITESGRFVFAREPFVNEFWAEADGHIVKSRQTLMPGAEPLEMTQVKWVGRND